MDSGAPIQDNVYKFIETLPSSKFDKLYSHPATCLCVFRSLPELAKVYLTRLLYVDTPIPEDLIKSWYKPEFKEQHDEALSKMKVLRICKIEGETLIINSGFRKNLKNAMNGGGESHAFGVIKSSHEKEGDIIETLDKFAKKHWESILHYIAGIQSSQPPEGVVKLLRTASLMESSPDGKDKITNKGFQFLLQDVNTQIWAFLLQYVEIAEKELKMDMIEVLNFFFQLGCLTLGRAYSNSEDILTPTQRTLLEDLKDFGIVYQRKSTSSRFHPTRLATSLTSGHTLTTNQETEGFIIIETNFKIYAYTNSPLQIATLNLFIDLHARFPNMIIGSIQRSSIHRAFANGITHEQILNYLNQHAHPVLRKNKYAIPPTVADQIRLWQLERDRLQISDGYVLTGFSSISEFQAYHNFAKGKDILLHSSPPGKKPSGILVITPKGIPLIKEFKKNLPN